MKHALWVACVAAIAGACTRTASPPSPTPEQPAAPSKAATPAASQAQGAGVRIPADTWILPGRLGPLTTRLELDARFGKANVREETFGGAEGIGSYLALVVFAEDPRKRLELVLEGDNPDAPIRELRVSGNDSLWHDASGLRTGISLAELVALNGAPVSFYGLGWDYGGTVSDWHGGLLANTVGNPLFHRVTLAARAGTDHAALPIGDRSFRSDDPDWPRASHDLVVGELGISWPHDGED